MKKKFRVLLINGNPTVRPYRVAPLGLAFIASSLKSKGHDVLLLDFPFGRKPLKKFLKQASEFFPDLIGMGIRNLDNSDFHAFQDYLKEPGRLLEDLRNLGDLKNVPVVLGGSAATVDPKRVLEHIKADSIALGEGEVALERALNYLEKGESLPTVLCEPGQTPFRVNDCSELPAPRLVDYVEIEQYLKRDAGYPIQTKRGCPLRCSYCTYARIEGKQYRLLHPVHIVDEIEYAASKGVREFEFVDSTFNLPVSHAMKVLEELSSRNLEVKFTGTGVNPLNLPEKLLTKMSECGFENLILTAESASETMLKSYQKDFGPEKLIHAMDRINQSGIRALVVFLLGGPGETLETVQETLDFISNHVKEPHVAYITNGIRLYPGSPIHEQMLKGKLAESDLSFHKVANSQVPFHLSSELGNGKLMEVLVNYQNSNPNILLSDQGQGVIVDIAQSLLGMGLAPKPLWRYVPLLNKIQNFIYKPFRGLVSARESHLQRSVS